MTSFLMIPLTTLYDEYIDWRILKYIERNQNKPDERTVPLPLKAEVGRNNQRIEFRVSFPELQIFNVWSWQFFYKWSRYLVATAQQSAGYVK